MRRHILLSFKIRYASYQHLRVIDVHHPHGCIVLRVHIHIDILLPNPPSNTRKWNHVVDKVSRGLNPRLHFGVSSIPIVVLPRPL